MAKQDKKREKKKDVDKKEEAAGANPVRIPDAIYQPDVSAASW